MATAPRADDGHLNLSPKGLSGTFAVLDRRTVANLDVTGSGVATIAHVRDNGRIVGPSARATDGIARYQAVRTAQSIDNLPGLAR